jgi:hypothetical protein
MCAVGSTQLYLQVSLMAAAEVYIGSDDEAAA